MGAILANLPVGVEFGQPVFADTMLLVPTQGKGLWAYANAPASARSAPAAVRQISS